MNVRTLRASRNERTVVLVTLELPEPLYVIVLHLPPDKRGRSQDWSRTTRDGMEAATLYEQAVADNVTDDDRPARPPVRPPVRGAARGKSA